MSNETRELIIPAGRARLWRMRAGERVTIAQTEGHQVGDFIAFNAADLTEFLSPSHTRRCLNRFAIGKGHCLYTNHREPSWRSWRTRSASTTCSLPPATRIATGATTVWRTIGAAG